MFGEEKKRKFVDIVLTFLQYRLLYVHLLVSYFSRFFRGVTLKTSILSVDQFSFIQSAALLVIGKAIPVKLFSYSVSQSVSYSLSQSFIHFVGQSVS